MGLYQELGEYTPDNLIAGNTINIALVAVTIKSGQSLERGTVLGIDTDGNGVLCDSTAEDGSQTAKYILAEDIDATEEELVAQCYQSGEFNREALILGGEDTVADHEDELRTVNIVLKSLV